jgi:hypothetical protein
MAGRQAMSGLKLVIWYHNLSRAGSRNARDVRAMDSMVGTSSCSLHIMPSNSGMRRHFCAMVSHLVDSCGAG